MSPPSPLRSDGHVAPYARVALQVLWFVLVPALLTGFVMRYLVPSPGAVDGDLLEGIGRIGNEFPIPLGAGLFLVFGALLRYWRFELPGGRHLSASPEVDGRRWKSARLLSGMALAGGLALVLRASFFESYRVLSASMLPTLEAGDRIGTNKLAYGLGLGRSQHGLFARTPRRGDVIVFENRTGEGPPHLVKRVIGLPGDRIEMRGGHPIINGWELPSCDAGTYLYVLPEGGVQGRLRVEFVDDAAYLTLHSAVARPFPEPYVVKPGEVFVLGDNRNNSSDSRAWNGGRGGGVPLAAIDGRAQWFLVGIHRDDTADFSRLMQPLGRRLHLEGVDVRALERGIERCLKNRPRETHVETAPIAFRKSDSDL